MTDIKMYLVGGAVRDGLIGKPTKDYDYTVVDNKFQMVIPGSNKALLAGLEGSPDKTQDATSGR